MFDSGWARPAFFNNIMAIELRNISTAFLFPNEGQIPGVKKNPRFIKDERFAALCNSINADPEMLELRELIVYPLEENHFVVIGGNMRLRAGEELGFTEMPCKVVPHDWPKKKIEAVIIKDNTPFGEDDWDLLFNEWDEFELKEWGKELPFRPAVEESEAKEPIATTTIKLEYTLEDYERVKNYLALIDSSPEQAVWKLCGFN